VSQDRHTVLGDGVSNPWNNGLVIEMTAFVQDIDRAVVNDQGELHRIAHFNVQTTLFRFLDNASRAVEARPPTENGQTKRHTAPPISHVLDCIGCPRTLENMSRL
jgi:hypothetical protein